VSGVYLDYNASGLVRPEVQDVMAQALADTGNPSAVHAAGRRARARRPAACTALGLPPSAKASAMAWRTSGRTRPEAL
jgi:cysteine desulfurase